LLGIGAGVGIGHREVLRLQVMALGDVLARSRLSAMDPRGCRQSLGGFMDP
jgi:hypothetical protein